MLKGNRVTLRPFRKDDLQKIWAYRTDVEVELAGGGGPPTPLRFEQIEAEYEKGEFIFSGGFAIEIDGEMSGYCGIFGFNELCRTCEIGITIGDRDKWGLGYGREAMGLLLHYAFILRNVRRVWLSTSSTNERALQCYKSCGFAEEGRLRLHIYENGIYADQVYMGILRDEWEINQS